MKPITFGEAACFVKTRVWRGDRQRIITGAAVDSRRVKKGDLFFALIGEKTDGHTFVSHALQKGAAGIVSSRSLEELSLPPEVPVFIVDDPLKALWELANGYLHVIGPTVIGVTGSVGKTTSKDMIASVLSSDYQVHKNQGNLNTEIGLPLSILEMKEDDEIAVLEMAMRGQGQIAELAAIAEPKVGVVTNIGETHIEILGSIENIAKAKGELLRALPADGVAAVNGDDPWCRKIAQELECQVYYFSKEGNGDVLAEEIVNLKDQGISFTIASGERRFPVHIPLPGMHNVENALAAVTVGLFFGVDPSAIAKQFSRFTSSSMRMEIIRREDFTVINDTYNASPRSTEAALDVLKDMKGKGSTMAILGDMLELGEREEEGHREIGSKVAAKGIDRLITVGDRAKFIAKAAVEAGMAESSVFAGSSKEEALEALRDNLDEGDTILVKGSRGMAMEDIVEAMLEIPSLHEGGG